MRTNLTIAIGLIALTTASAGAQGRGRNTDGVPPGHRPPAGMCRIWIAGVPPGQQAAPTDCATARATVPANGRVIYGTRPGRRADRVDHGRRDHDDNLLTRRRQLADGTWVIDRYRLDSNGNIVVVSTKPWRSNDAWKGDHKNEKRALKAHQKAEKRALKDRRDELGHDAMKDAREDLKDHQKTEKRQLKDRFDDRADRGGKGKGKNK